MHHTQINWGDIATWLTGIVTLGLFVVGAIQIWQERQHRKKVEKEQEDRNKREQAIHISCWIEQEEHSGAWITISNQSGLPVYQMIVNWLYIKQDDQPRSNISIGMSFLDVVPPGTGYVLVKGQMDYGMFRRSGVEIAFRDSAGANWARKSNGNLLGLEIAPHEYYSLHLPLPRTNIHSESEFKQMI